MALIATDSPRMSDVVFHMYEPSIGYCTETLKVDVTGFELGTVLDDTGAIVAKAKEADATYVVIDETVAGKKGSHQVLVLARAPAIVVASELKTASDITDKANVIAALKAKGILTV